MGERSRQARGTKVNPKLRSSAMHAWERLQQYVYYVTTLAMMTLGCSLASLQL